MGVEDTPALPLCCMTFDSTTTVLVTGASRGLGAAFAQRIARTGARVVLVARSEAALAEVADRVLQLGGEPVVLDADLAQPGTAADLASRLADADLAIDGLVNNAGYGVAAPFLDASPDDAEGMVMLNAVALTGLTRQLVPGMVSRGRGGVLNVASIAGFAPSPRFAVYAATKAYVRSFSDALHAELRGTGVAVTCLHPGPVRTGFAKRAGMDDRFFSGALPAETVVAAGLAALAAGRRQIVPGWTNKVQTAATRVVPTALTLRVAEAVMRRAG